MSATSPESSSRSGIPQRFAPRRLRVDYPTTAAVPALSPEQWIATELGRTPAGVHQLLFRPFRSGLTLPRLTALCITGFLETRALDRLAHWAGPIRQAFADAHAIEVSATLFRTTRAADSDDDKSQVAYIVEPTPENAKRLVADLDRSVARLLELRSALVTKHQLEQT